MAREDITNLLDLYIDSREKVLESVPEGLRLIEFQTKTIQFWDLRPIIEALDVDFEHKYDTRFEYPHTLEFYYRGYRIFALYNEEDFKEVNEWMTAKE